MRSLVEHAILAPSSHNTQPWRFRLGQAHVDVLADRTRALPANDPDHRELVISCGCALMSLRSAAAGRGVATEVELLPDPDDPDWLARVSVAKPAAAPSEAELAPFLPRRRTCRRPFATREVDAAVGTKLADAARTEAAWLRPITTSAARREVAGLVAEGDAVQWANPAWRRELAEWTDLEAAAMV